MSYGLAEAAAACSLNKSTVRRAIKIGKVSATKDAHGQWHIEPAELHRVYPPRTEASTEERIRAHISEIALLRERIEDLKTLTDEFRVWVRDLTEQRDRAEARAAELDKRLLTYQPPAPTLPPPRRRWWRRSASTV
jgi:FtsZ-binding cell division protein ZapB